MCTAIAGAGDLASQITRGRACHRLPSSRRAKPTLEALVRAPRHFLPPNRLPRLNTSHGPRRLGRPSLCATRLLARKCHHLPRPAGSLPEKAKCKRSIPSDYGGNIDIYPDSPVFHYVNHESVRQALRAQTDVTWTLSNMGWLSDYFVPAGSQYVRDIGDFHPVNFETGILTIPRTCEELICFTSACDAARAIACLID
jgi:hypothetical protein